MWRQVQAGRRISRPSFGSSCSRQSAVRQGRFDLRSRTQPGAAVPDRARLIFEVANSSHPRVVFLFRYVAEGVEDLGLGLKLLLKLEELHGIDGTGIACTTA